MRLAFLLFLTVMIFQGFAFAQTDKSACPGFSVQVISPPFKPEKNIDYKVIFDRAFDTSRLTYIWTVYNGKILSGQGASSVTVKPEKPDEKSITATAKVQGLPENCPDTASVTVSIDPQPLASEILPCPTISIESPEDAVMPGAKVVFKAKVEKGFDISKLKYIWTLSAGKILKGQKTKSILAEPSIDTGSITATVEVLGLPKECGAVTASLSLGTYCPPVATALDEYSKLTPEEEKEKLNLLSAALNNDPHAAGFITKAYSLKSNKQSIYQDLRRMLNYLESIGLEKDRIDFGVAGAKEESTKIYLVPRGAERPEFKGDVFGAAKLAGKLDSAKPAAKEKTAGKN